MPTYQYRCADCGEERDVIQSFTDDALTTCPVCEGRFRKVFSAVGVVFKGSGFYRNDSRTSAEPASNGASSDGSSGESSSDSSPKESAAKESGSASKTDASKSDSGKGSSSTSKDSGSAAKQPTTT